MNKNIVYRNVERKDYEKIKELIKETFLIPFGFSNEKTLNKLSIMFLNFCLSRSNYSKVALKDGKVIGIILGSSKNDKNKIVTFGDYFEIIKNGLELVFIDKESRRLMKETCQITRIYSEFIKNKKNEFQGCLELFIVAKEARGFGVGKNLNKNLIEYMKEQNVEKFYLYTDSCCTYQFYESQGYERIEEKSIDIKILRQIIDVYMYSYNLKK